MAIARFKDLCIDAIDPELLGRFWAAASGLTWQPDEAGTEGSLTGRTEQHRIWVNKVPEPKTVKNRVHLDLYTRSPESLHAPVLHPEGEHGIRWTVMADPEGNEFCAFVREELPADLLHGLVVDSADPAAQADWWGEVYGAEVVHHVEGWSTVQKVPGMPIQTMDFVPVPEPKTVKNRVHWDVYGSPDALVAAGATLLRPLHEDGIRWTVMADPEGNEFCAFTP